MTSGRHWFAVLLSLCVVAAATRTVRAGTPIVPGTGEFLAALCDDFENPEWSYKLNLPKSSEEQDKQERGPGGKSSNGLWAEGAKRGTPDVVKRVPTPPGGIEGSTGALMFATKFSGIPGSISNSQMQDDLLMKFDKRLKNGGIPVSWQPSCTVRVYLPPFDQWEQRNGPSFGMRADVRGKKPDGTIEPYWPGMFWLLRTGKMASEDGPFAQLTVRAGPRGNDLRSVKAAEPGWWTLGLSFSPDGQVHYYAHQGVEDLTADDYLASEFPYGNKCQLFKNFFFNVANWDNGKSWSTTWVIDDPKVYAIPPGGHEVAELFPVPRQQSQQRQIVKNNSGQSQDSQQSASNSNNRRRTQR